MVALTSKARSRGTLIQRFAPTAGAQGLPKRITGSSRFKRLQRQVGFRLACSGRLFSSSSLAAPRTLVNTARDMVNRTSRCRTRYRITMYGQAAGTPSMTGKIPTGTVPVPGTGTVAGTGRGLTAPQAWS